MEKAKLEPVPPILWLILIGVIAFGFYKKFFEKDQLPEMPKYAPVVLGPAKYPVIPVPSDRVARYQVLSRTNEGGMIKALIMREGPSGTTYSYKQFDCAGSYAYLGEGDTAEKALHGKADPMSELTAESISSYESLYLCNTRTATP